MRRAAWKRRLSQPATRVAVVAGLVVALVIGQFVLLIVGSAAADREARNAARDSIEYLADISEERVLNSVRAVDQAVHGAARYVRMSEPDSDELLGLLKSELMNTAAIDALSVTRANGDYVELRRSSAQFGGYHSYSVDYISETVVKRTETEYDADLTVLSTHSSEVAFGTTRSDAYLGALTSSRVAWTGPSADPFSGRDVVRASLAVREPTDTVVLVVTANLAIVPLQHSLSTLPTGTDGAISVLTSDGVVIAAPWSRPPRPPTGRPAVDGGVEADPMPGADQGKLVLPGSGGGYTIVQRTLADDGVDWVVEVRASELGINAGFGELRQTLNAVMGGLMILTLVLGYLLTRLWRPMMAMRAGAERDALTGLYNRRHADAAAESMVRFANRTGARAAFVMMDLDDFKSLNDDLGHVDGDRALAAVGAHVSSQIRAGDLAARWGGDEFLLVLLLAADDDPEDVVERIRVGTSEALAYLFPGRFDLGVTAGFATTDVVGDDVGVLIASADRALVRGKAVAKGYTYALAPQP